MKRPPRWLLMTGLFLLVLALAFASLSAGRINVPWRAWAVRLSAWPASVCGWQIGRAHV